MQLNLNQDKRKLQLTLFGILIIVVLVVAIAASSVFKRGDSSQKLTVDKVIPPKEVTQNLPQDTKEIRQKIINSKIREDRGDIIIYESPEYKITYIPTPDIFLVTINKAPVENYKKQAQDYFLKFGLKQKDLCTLPVRFVIFDFELKNQNPDFDILPDGC